MLQNSVMKIAVLKLKEKCASVPIKKASMDIVNGILYVSRMIKRCEIGPKKIRMMPDIDKAFM